MKFELNVVLFDANDVVTSSVVCANPNLPTPIGNKAASCAKGVVM